MSVSKIVDQAIQQSKIVVFSKSYCPYCKRAKAILRSKNIDFKVFELDELDNGDAIQGYLRQKTNQGTVPNIFIGQKHVGGCSDLEAAEKKGQLDKMLAS
ncbi:glutaredoxin, partial [Gorgonomyces haynaldii]